MQLENSFEVHASIEQVWSYLLGIEEVVPCMPGAELTETIDERNWKGKVKIKLGAITLQFAGRVAMEERDDQMHRVVLKASGMEQRGKGSASATVTSTLQALDPASTRVVIVQDLELRGQAAQMSRGMLPDVTAMLTQQFADCIKANLEAARATEPGEEPKQVKAGEIRAISLGASALWAAIKRFFRRLFARK